MHKSTLNTNMRSKTLLSSISAALAITLFSCASLGSPEDEAMGNDLWGAIDGYQSWATAPGWEGFQESGSVHGNYVKIYVNPVLAGSLANPAAGSIVVKEGFGKQEDDSINAVTVMQKVEGYGADSGGWFYARYSPSGKMSHAGTPGMCTDCHYSAGGDDFLYINDD